MSQLLLTVDTSPVADSEGKLCRLMELSGMCERRKLQTNVSKVKGNMRSGGDN